MNTPHVLGLQMDLAWEKPELNRAHALDLIARRQPPPNSLVVLPEMFNCGFTMNATAVAESPGGATETWLSQTAKQHQTWVVAGFARKNAHEEIGNDAVVADPHGVIAGVYRKQRPFSVGGESLHYKAGSRPLVFSWGEVRVAVFICYDLRFPELFRVAAQTRPELYVVIASWPDKRIAHWLKLLQARAIENQAYVIGVNRIGKDPSHQYPGRSMIANPWGEIISESSESETFVEADIDLATLREYRERLPFLEDLPPA
jgi:predicted amidohydrolase